MAVGFMMGAPISANLVARLGTKWTVTLGLLLLGGAVVGVGGHHYSPTTGLNDRFDFFVTSSDNNVSKT